MLRIVFNTAPRVPRRVKLQLSTVETCLTTHHLLASFPFVTHFPVPLLAFPDIYSQINDIHSNSCSRVWDTHPEADAYTVERFTQTKSKFPSHPQTGSHTKWVRLNTLASPGEPQTTSFLRIFFISLLENNLFLFPPSFPSPAFPGSLVTNRSSLPHSPQLPGPRSLL